MSKIVNVTVPQTANSLLPEYQTLLEELRCSPLHATAQEWCKHLNFFLEEVQKMVETDMEKQKIFEAKKTRMLRFLRKLISIVHKRAEQTQWDRAKSDNVRPKFFMSDFGAGKYVFEVQTALEISALFAQSVGFAGWESLWWSSCAPELNIQETAYFFTHFPELRWNRHEITDEIKKIVVHVIDPGVGNNAEDGTHHHQRMMILRNDGTLFIGPNNGNLSFVCPKGSVSKMWEIDADLMDIVLGNNTKAGGTFHGRDLFATAMALVDIGIHPEYIGNEVEGEMYRLPQTKREISKKTKPFPPERLSCVHLPGDRVKLFSYPEWNCFIHEKTPESQALKRATIVNFSTYPIFQKKGSFPIVRNIDHPLVLLGDPEPEILLFNHSLNTIFVGKNDGTATALLKDFREEKLFAVEYAPIAEIWENDETTTAMKMEKILAKNLPSYVKNLKMVDFLGSENDTQRDEMGRVKKISSKIAWIDCYGNVKLSAESHLFREAQAAKVKKITLLCPSVAEKKVELSGISVYANSFSDVNAGDALLYVGSSASIGCNPDRSRRWIEFTLSSDGSLGQLVYGRDVLENTFGKDFVFVSQEIEMVCEYE